LNSYTGSTTISGGTLSLAGSGIISASSALAIGASGTFDIATGAGAKTIGTLTGSGPITLNDNDLTIPSGTYSGDISDSGTGGSITKNTGGTLTLSGSSSYGGGTTLTLGTLRYSADANLGGGGAAVDLNGGILEPTASFTSTLLLTLTADSAILTTLVGTTLTQNGVIDEFGGAFALTKSGAGTLELGATNSYSGGTNIVAGTLSLVGASSTLGAANSALDIDPGGTFNIATSAGAKTIGALTGSGSITLDNNDLTIQSGSYGGIISDDGVNGSITKNTSGTLVLSGSNTYFGGTTITDGILQCDTRRR